MSGHVGAEIVTRIAEAENTDPLELTPPLADVVDVDALRAVLESSGNGTSVEFGYRDWTVEARANGTIKLRGSVDAD